MSVSKTLKVVNPAANYVDNHMEVKYSYCRSIVNKEDDNTYKVKEQKTELCIKTDLRVPRLGVMLVGWGGNNGSTFTAALLANKLGLTWPHKTGEKKANWFGSITQSSTVNLGVDELDQEVYVPMCDMLPMINPNDIVLDGWDISPLNLSEAMKRAEVLDYALQEQLVPHMKLLQPRPGIYDPDFIAANQEDRAENVIGGSKFEQYQRVRADIREFKGSNKLDQVIVLWTANTERFCTETEGVHMTAEQLEKALKDGHTEISPSTIFGIAAVEEGCSYINGSPQNTLVPGLREMAQRRGVFLGGDDFKSGQTKFKSVIVDFLVNAGIKPVSIVSYNHLGNNDGKNLSAPKQFRSKEITKSNVVDDMVAANKILYSEGEKPDHCVVIKYVPYVGDSKRAMDEYTSEILLGGHNTIVVHNTCEDSLLAVPIMLDLIILAELFSRVSVDGSRMDTVLSLLSYLLKAPAVPQGAPVVNALSRQRSAIENVLRACLGLAPLSHLQLEHRFPRLPSLHSTCNGNHTADTSPPNKRVKRAH